MPILKDVTNSFYGEDGSGKRWGEPRKKELARRRWEILAKALLEPEKLSLKSVNEMEHSIRRFSSFGLFRTENLKNNDGDAWLEYSYSIFDRCYRIRICQVEQKFTPKDLAGYNNTGNICIWPSEEVLGFYLLSNVGLFERKDVLEVGGGMTCLAGLLLVKYGEKCRVDVTDGNPKSVTNVERIIAENELDSSRVRCFHLDWRNHQRLTRRYDYVLSSDCLFFDETRSDLVEAVWHLLKEEGTGIMLAPSRGTTLNTFVTMAKRRGFNCKVRRHYDGTVWRKHLEFKQTKSEYDEDLHYPVLLLLKKSNREEDDANLENSLPF